MRPSPSIAMSLVCAAMISPSMQMPVSMLDLIGPLASKMSAGNSIDTLQVLYKRSPEGRSVADEKIHYSIIEEKIDKYKEKYQEAPAGSQEEKAAKAGLGIWNHRAKAYTDEGKARVVANQYYYRRNEVEKDKMPHYRAWTAHANALKEAKKFRV